MGACRENMNIFNKHSNSRRYIWLRFLYRLRLKTKARPVNWRLVYEDSFMPMVCKLVGHKGYQPDPEWEPEEWACKRCHRFLPNRNINKGSRIKLGDATRPF
jgi:hypothetical protein